MKKNEKNKDTTPTRRTTAVRVYFTNDEQPVILENLKVKLAGGFVTGRVDGMSVAYPPHRINRLEAIDRGQEWQDVGKAETDDPYETQRRE